MLKHMRYSAPLLAVFISSPVHSLSSCLVPYVETRDTESILIYGTNNYFTDRFGTGIHSILRVGLADSIVVDGWSPEFDKYPTGTLIEEGEYTFETGDDCPAITAQWSADTGWSTSFINTAPEVIDLPSEYTILKNNTNTLALNNTEFYDAQYDHAKITFTVGSGVLIVNEIDESLYPLFYDGSGSSTLDISIMGFQNMFAHDFFEHISVTPEVDSVEDIILSVTMTDGDLTSEVVTSTLHVVPIIISAVATKPTFIKNGPAVSLFNATSITMSAVERNVTALTVAVAGLDNTTNEILTFDGSDIALQDGASGITAGNNFSYLVSLNTAIDTATTTATVTLSNGSITSESMAALIDSMGYRHLDDNPSSTERVITLTAIADDGGTDSDVATIAISSTVVIQPRCLVPYVVTSDSESVFWYGYVNYFTDESRYLETKGLADMFVVSLADSKVTISDFSEYPTGTLIEEGEYTIETGDRIGAGHNCAITAQWSADTGWSTSFINTAPEIIDLPSEYTILKNNTNTLALNNTEFYDAQYDNAKITFTVGSGVLSAEPVTNDFGFYDGLGTPTLDIGIDGYYYMFARGFFENISVTPEVDSVEDIILSVTMTDGDLTSEVVTSTLHVVPIIISAAATEPTYIENGPAVSLYNATSITMSAVERNVTALTVAVAGLDNTTNEILTFDGSDIALQDGASGITADNNFSYLVSLNTAIDTATTTATVTLSNGSITSESMAALIDSMGYQHLDDNPSSTERVITLTAIADDGGTDSDVATIAISSTVVIQPVNDAALFSGDLSFTMVEDGPAVTSKIDINDVDDDHLFVVQENISTQYGIFDLDVDGYWGYEISETNTTVQALPQDAVLTDIITIQAIDGTYGQVVITITGVNGIATITGVSIGAATEDNDVLITGQLLIDDEDSNQAAFVVQDGTAGSYGQFSLTVAGNWSYDLDNGLAAVQALADGATATDSFTAMSVDGTGSQVVTITITGVNGIAVITGTSTGAATEDNDVLITGQLLIDDEDSNEAAFVVQDGTAGSYGQFSLTHDGWWNYQLKNSWASVQALADGATATDSFTAMAVDGTGSQVVTVTITGVNGIAVITGTSTGAATEDNDVLITGQLSIEDEDSNEAAFVVQDGTAGSYGQFSLTHDGWWNYQLKNSWASVQALADGATATDSFTAMAVDGTGSQVVTITITGVNGIPTITGTSIGAATEDNDVLITGQLSIDDEDSNEAAFVVQDGTAGSYGQFSLTHDGWWNYQLKNSWASVQALADGATATDSFTAMAVDGTGSQVVTVTITGVNGIAVITGTSTGAATEDNDVLITGQLSIDDEDSNEAAFVVQDGTAGTYGQFSLTVAGNWSYDLDNGLAAVQALADGATLTDSFTAMSVDGTGSQVVTVTITGVNGIPTITGTSIGAATEDNDVLITGQLLIDDEDSNQAEFVAQNFTDGSYGQFSLTVAGNWSYDLDNGLAAVQALADGATLTDSFTAMSVDGTGSQVVTITITGVNGIAVITGTSTGAATEDNDVLITGQLLIDDEDSNQAAFVVQDGTDGSYGQFSLTVAGNWSYDLDNGLEAVQALADGATLTDSFTAMSVDGTGSQVVTVTITGVNGIPTITGTSTGAATEDNDSLITGQLSIDDEDSNQAEFVVQDGTAGSYGQFSLTVAGNWSYDLDNGLAAVQALADGVTLTDSFTAMSVDGTGSQVVTITITGVNGIAVITGTSTGAATEDNDVLITGQLSIDDEDSNEAEFVVQNLTDGSYGQFSLTAAGNWSYDLDNGLAAVQALADGATLTDSFTAMSVDGTGSQVVTVTITGVNGIATITGTSTGAATEDNDVLITGQLLIDDEDSNQAEFVVQNFTDGSYGQFSLTVAGNWSYDLDNGLAAVQALADGATLTDSFTAMSVDGTDSQVVTVTITGVNGIPTITGTSTGAATEDNDSLITGQLSIDDEDSNEAAFVVQDGTDGSYGQFSLTVAGNWSYDLDNGLAAVQALADGATLTDSFTAMSVDGTGSQVVTVTITGVNGIAVITGTSTGAATEDNDVLITGQLSIDDEDSNEAAFVVQDGTAGTYGQFSLTVAGNWSYDLDNGLAAVQALADGATLTDSFTAMSVDGTGSQVVTVTITGVNGIPTITGTSTGAATEDNDVLITGQLLINDEDSNEAEFVAQNLTAGSYGQFSLTVAGNWSYDLDNGLAAVQALADGATLTDSFTAMSVDGTGSQVVTVTITGVNGIAVITGTSTGAATEDNDVLITGQLSIDDEDSNQAEFVAQNLTAGSYGQFSLTVAGNWSYDLDNGLEAVQALADGATLTDSFTAMAVDGTGSQVVTVTITGVNGIPTITGTSTGAATEDNDSLITGQLLINDEDSNQAEFVVQDGTDGSYGQFSLTVAGNWSYDLDNGLAAVQALADGATLTDSFTAMSVDGTGSQVVTVTITGVNGIPTITGTSTGAATEDNDSLITGQLSIDDEDSNQAAFVVQDGTDGSYGQFSLTVAGNWSYDLDNGLEAVQALADGATLTDSFTAMSVDGTGSQVVTVTITGVNGIPTITGTSTGAATEDNDVLITGQLSIEDEDSNEAAFVVQDGTAGSYGQFSLTHDGWWNYQLKNSWASVQALADGATATDSFTAMAVDGTGSQVVTVTITGVNGIPTITGTSTGAATEDNDSLITGLLSIDDEDSNEAAFVVQDGTDGSYGQFSLTHDGWWNYQLKNSWASVQALADGATATDSFTAMAVDGTGSQVVTVTITGVNGIPTITGTSTGAATEDNDSLITGLLSIDDEDSNEAAFVVQDGTDGSYGQFSLTVAGNWSYDLDNGLAAVQALADGATLTDSFTAMSVDGTGSQVVTVTITGVNGIATITGTSTGAATEDNDSLITGQLLIDDEDSNQAEFVVQDGTDGTYGQFSLTVAGNWSYDLDNGLAAVQALADGATLTDSFTAMSVDGTGSQVVTVTITGVNGIATITGTSTGAATEDNDSLITGQLSIDDEDSNEAAFVVQDGTDGSYGQFSLTVAGNWSYDLDNGLAAVQALADGATLTDSFTAMSVDGTGSQVVTVTITGVNGIATITGTSTGAATEDNDVLITGQLLIDDEDSNQAEFVAQNLTAGSYGQFSLTVAGNWSYDLDNGLAAVQALADGATLTDSFTAMSVDGTGSQVVTVTITGVNGIAVITGTSTGAATEDNDVLITGQLLIDDEDSNQALFVAQNLTAGTYGQFSLTAAGNWSYDLDNGLAAVQALADGATLTDSFTAMAVDGTGSQVVTVTITGVNGIATITGTSTGAATEDNDSLITGQLSIDDEDSNQAEFVVQDGTAGSYGQFSLTVAGNWSYDLDNGLAAVQALADGATLTDSFTAMSVDGTGSQVVTVTITGVNGIATITGTSTGAATEDNDSLITGQLLIDDEDSNQAEFVVQDGTDGTYGQFSLTVAGNWSYDLDNGLAAVQALADGATLTDSFTAMSVDGTGSQVVTVTITGVNGIATITGTSTGAATEDNDSLITGQLSIDDEDSNEAAFVVQDGTDGSYGQFSLTVAGNWSYDLDNGLAAVQALADGATLTDSFTAMSVDGTGSQVVTVTITGVNGIATITGTSTGAATEDNDVLITGQLLIDDEDSNQAEFVAQNLTAGSYGQFSLTVAGNWSYDLDNGLAAVQALADGATLTDSFTAMSVDGTGSQVVTITITGVNGIAVITGTSTGTLTEDDVTTVTGELKISDEDADQAVFISQENTIGDYGFFSLTFSGSWSYQIDIANLAVQLLHEGESLTDSFTVSSIDGSDTQIVTVTITGVNGIAIIAGTAVADLDEDSTKLITGQLLITDEDRGENIFVAQTEVLGQYGAFSIDSLGHWSFDLDTGNINVQKMTALELLTDSFTVESIDGTGQQVVTVTIYGVNDAPIAVNDTVTLDYSVDNRYVIDVLANDSDIDGDTLSVIAGSATIGDVTVEDNKLVYQPHMVVQGSVQLTYVIDDNTRQANSTAEGMVELNIIVDVDALMPVITPPEDIVINATGLYTKADLGVAQAIDKAGVIIPASLINSSTMFKPGRHVAYWQAIDNDGFETTATQNVVVNPIISISNDMEVAEGNNVDITVHLNGDAPSYPVTVPYHVSGTANNTDHDLTNGEVVINDGLVGHINFTVFGDELDEGTESIKITLDSELNLGTHSSVNVSIVERNIAPQVTVKVMQNNETRSLVERNQQEIVFVADVSDANSVDSHTYQWTSADDLQINSADEEGRFTLSSADLPLGVTKLILTVTDNGSPALITQQEVYIEVIEALVELTMADTDGDLIPDVQEGFGDEDSDGIPDYLDVASACNVMPEIVTEPDSFLVEGEAGVCLRKGSTVASNKSGAIQLEPEELLADESMVNSGGIFDFIAYGLPMVGQSYSIVLPQLVPIPEGAVYRKYSGSKGWFNFVVDNLNNYSSSKGELGFCPPPQSEDWTTGLTAGHWCVQLTIEDGGPNDDDGVANGSIVDPGGVAVNVSTNHAPTVTGEEVLMAWNTVQVINVLDNDSDIDGDSLSIMSESVSVDFGEVDISGDTLIYTPAEGYFGSATIYYGVSDDNGGSSYAMVNVNVIGNQEPIANNDTASTNDRTPITVNVLANDTDSDVGDLLTVSRAVAVQGAVVINADSTLTYTPKAGFEGEDVITYIIDDGHYGQATAQLKVNIKAYETVVISNGSSGGAVGLLSLLLSGFMLLIRKLKLQKLPAMVVAVLALTTLNTSCLAGWQVNGAVGYANANNSELTSYFRNGQVSYYNDTDLSWQLGVAYRLDNDLIFSVSYLDMGEGKATITADSLDPVQYHKDMALITPVLANGYDFGVSYEFWQLQDVGFAIQGGFFAWQADLLSEYEQQTIRHEKNGFDSYFGLEAIYSLSQQWQISVGFKRYHLTYNDVDNSYISLGYNF
ncbi:VCBS domain-containing protein [Shewanella youngdeokensis]|uniref:VCBS domain-containing protein n=1 Tax=Shewanella youngdeokensis TaxID=2999068 RepID=A0ABZ0K2Q6_9GAMM|nr:VCBS domain-containing protein [Shewanella sp. DAU334]